MTRDDGGSQSKTLKKWSFVLALDLEAIMGCTVAEGFQGINDFSLVVLYKTSKKSLDFCTKDFVIELFLVIELIELQFLCVF